MTRLQLRDAHEGEGAVAVGSWRDGVLREAAAENQGLIQSGPERPDILN
jgi:hypothetical protein